MEMKQILLLAVLTLPSGRFASPDPEEELASLAERPKHDSRSSAEEQRLVEGEAGVRSPGIPRASCLTIGKLVYYRGVKLIVDVLDEFMKQKINNSLRPKAFGLDYDDLDNIDLSDIDFDDLVQSDFDVDVFDEDSLGNIDGLIFVGDEDEDDDEDVDEDEEQRKMDTKKSNSNVLQNFVMPQFDYNIQIQQQGQMQEQMAMQGQMQGPMQVQMQGQMQGQFPGNYPNDMSQFSFNPGQLNSYGPMNNFKGPDSNSNQSFTLSGNSNNRVPAMVGSTGNSNYCQSDYLIIPMASNVGRPATGLSSSVDRICGGVLAADVTTMPTPVRSNVRPFHMYFHSDGVEAPNDIDNKGFCLNYIQVPCANAFT
ncbi:unnamed protein product [Phyllotreta striolata]|uniref:CUB domain-containing protein n=1 Tax=Phyllotreta striolata TaxID=444603 RepID=A0A9N9TYA8_PHYSR|nr:unnamed protein product [Phyllotreta striolata]